MCYRIRSEDAMRHTMVALVIAAVVIVVFLLGETRLNRHEPIFDAIVHAAR